jgi:hypothetical protein
MILVQLLDQLAVLNYITLLNCLEIVPNNPLLRLELCSVLHAALSKVRTITSLEKNVTPLSLFLVVLLNLTLAEAFL